MAIAGHLPGVAKLRLVNVQDQDIDDDGALVRGIGIHCNAPMLRVHDGSPMFCKEHGKSTDLSVEPE
jgi:hypothetical protein